VYNVVLEEIKKEIPESFGVVFDGWSCDSEHYIGIFATWVNKSGGVIERLLSCSVQDVPNDDDEAEQFGFTAEDIGDVFFDVMEKYNRSWEAIEFICGDNASVNRRLANLIENALRDQGIRRRVPLIGCDNHKLNLGVETLYAAGTIYHDVVNKVQSAMICLSSIKNAPRLRRKTNLAPMIRNATRWSSVFEMLKRYQDLHPNLDKCGFSDETKAKFLSIPETYLVTQLLEVLYQCHKTSIFLQTNDAHKVNLLSARVAKDKLIEQVPELEKYLAPNAEIVHSPAFESAVVKLQKGEPLSASDKVQLAIFKQADVVVNNVEENLTFEEEILRDVDATKRAAARGGMAEYRSTFHVSPTSNIVERLFSRAGLIMRPNRRQMDPSTLEMLLMLRLNKDMWSEGTLQDIIDKKKEVNRKRLLERDAEKLAANLEFEEEEDDVEFM
jgi:hypothetical protein